ncbi:MAG: hypothetical protein LBL00_02615 [Endomicrobium sp.]|jgi:hypothetical protein|nr:hypothetical protein [Endomicrobium sp.]
MGTIQPGFWNFKFIITPNEFEAFLKECSKYNIIFKLPVHGYPEHNSSQIMENYIKYYNGFANTVKQPRHTFVYSMNITGKNGRSSFHIISEEIRYLYNGQWPKDEMYYIRMTYPKGHAVTCENDPEHFIYEDILLHEPDIYPVYEELTNSIKSFTKPFRFINETEEIKPSGVRISESSAKELSLGYIFKRYNFQMKSFMR